MAERLPEIAALTNPAGLAAFLGPVRDVSVAPMHGVGYSGATHERVTVRLAPGGERAFVLKRTDLARDWTALRTGDAVGREALLLAEPALAGAWEAFECPYLAYATEPGRVALLMEDLTADLFPDERRPIRDDQEQALLTSLATLHARHWDHDALDRPWLVTTAQCCDLLAATILERPEALAQLSPELGGRVVPGWNAARRLLPAPARERMTAPGDELAREWADLPRTLLHGDTKVANFAVRPTGRVAAFDWALAGAGPCALDLGWYVAINATRHTRAKEQVIAAYRAKLEAALGSPLDESLWRRLEDAAIVTACRMLLWSKALALESGTPGGRAEWEWWVERLASSRS